MPLSLIPTPYRILVLAIAAALIFGAVYALGHAHGAAGVQAAWDKAKADQLQATIAAEASARQKEHEMTTKLEQAQNEATERETKLRADYAAAHAAALGLRDTVDSLRRSLSGDSIEACRATADAALAVFGECQARYGAVAEAADGCASDVKTLSDAWPE